MPDTVTMQQFCDAANYSAETQTCAAPYWATAYGGVPPLSVDDAVLIAGATYALWATAWILRPLVHSLLRRQTP